MADFSYDLVVIGSGPPGKGRQLMQLSKGYVLL